MSATDSRLLTRIYQITGFDRVLYAGRATWPEGTFEQDETDIGVLTLHRDGIGRPDELATARDDLDRRADEFMLRIELDYRHRLTRKLLRSIEPDVDPPGVLRANSRVSMSCRAEAFVAPRTPPATMPQAPLEGVRWVRTLAEATSFERFADEVLKRAYLLIEELWPAYESRATPDEVTVREQARLVRHFVSHPACMDKEVVNFVAPLLPSAVVPGTVRPTVRFDRTDIAHTNFVGRYQPQATSLAIGLVRDALGMTP